MTTQDHIMGLSLAELIDIPVFQNLCNSLWTLTKIPMGLVDREGKILVASGWQRICTQFHRKNQRAAANCIESDTILACHPVNDSQFNIYECKNGLIDVATPIIINGHHLGNLFVGQFLFETPDRDFFSKQADRFGFDRDDYLAALADVPIFSREGITKAVDYLMNLTTVIANAGVDKLRLLELNRNLEEKVSQRTKNLISEKTFSESLISSLPGIMYVFNRSGRFLNWNQNFEAVIGYSEEQILELAPLQIVAEPDRPRVKKTISEVFNKGSATVEARIAHRSGSATPYLLTGFKYRIQDADFLIGVGIDISERVKTEREKAVLIEKLQRSLEDVRQLSGLLPICSRCKKIRDDKGYWNDLESYIQSRSNVSFSHGICQDCAEQLYGKQDWYIEMKKEDENS